MTLISGFAASFGTHSAPKFWGRKGVRGALRETVSFLYEKIIECNSGVN